MAKEGLHACVFGGAHKDKKNSIIILDFDIDEVLKNDRGRALLVNLVNNFLDFINNTETIQPYLIDHPFTYKNIEFGILGIECDLAEAEDDYIQIVSLIKGDICYIIRNQENPFMLKIIKEEPFEEAERIVQEQGLLQKVAVR